MICVYQKVFVPLHCHIALIGSFGRHIEESAFRLFLLRKLDTYKSNIGVRRKTLFLVCIRIPTIYGQAELLILLSVLQGVQPYAADKKMLAPLFFLYALSLLSR